MEKFSNVNELVNTLKPVKPIYCIRPSAIKNAIKFFKEKFPGKILYAVKTNPNEYVLKNIINNGISEVYYSINDIDKKVRGKSFKILSDRKIKVYKGLLKKEAKNLYESYFVNRVNKLPYVTGKIAVSKNKLIYSKDIKRISDSFSDKFSHFLRYKIKYIHNFLVVLLFDLPHF